jgi:hypothetical protein
VPIGEGVDAGAFNAQTQEVFMSTGDGHLTVIHEDSPDKYTVVQTVGLPGDSRAGSNPTGSRTATRYGAGIVYPAGREATVAVVGARMLTMGAGSLRPFELFLCTRWQ